MHKNLLLTLIVCLCAMPVMYGQVCTTLGQNPTSAFPVCGTSVFSQSTVPICGSQPVPCPCANALLFIDKNPFWYKFTCFTAGTLGFVITPNTITDDYDWQLFDVTGHNPMDVYTDSSLFVACDWSGEGGLTGTADTGTALIFCDGFGVPPFSARPFLQQGHNYLLLISHFTNTQSGYGLSFGGGTAVITDTTPPRLAAAKINCSGTRISLKLNKKMKCSSLAANGSDFMLSGTAPPITSATGVNCSAAFDMDSIELTLSAPLAAGAYDLIAKNGFDANTLLDYCDAQVPVGNLVSFLYDPPPPPVIDSVAPVGCAPDKLLIHFNQPVQCSSIAANGSDFALTATTPAVVTAATFTCSSQLTSFVTLQLSAPIYHQGINTVKIKTGSDGNTVSTECGIQAIVGDSITFTTPADTVSAQFTFNIVKRCDGDTVHFFSSSSNGINQWTWQFDTSTSAVQNPVHVYNSFGIKQVVLIVSNGICSDTVTNSFTLSPPLPISTTTTAHAATCGRNNGSVHISATGGAGGFTYFWMPGNYITDSISNLAPGIYHVTVTDTIGCTKADSVIVRLVTPPQITAINHTNILCYGAHNGSAAATVINGTPQYSYSWTNGTSVYSGNSIQNIDTGTYLLTVTDSIGCTDTGTVTISQPQPLVHTVSAVSTSCALSNGSATIDESGGTAPYTYIWFPSGGTGDTATGLPAGNYVVGVTDGNGCIDTAHVQVATGNALSVVAGTVTPVTCYGKDNGDATVIAHGTPPYIYIWSPSVATDSFATSLAAGTYSVNVTDSIGCNNSITIQITTPDSLIVSSSVKGTTCGNDNGSASAFASGGIPPYSFAWSQGSTGSTLVDLASGSYLFTATDSNNCTANGVAIVRSSSPLLLTLTATPTVLNTEGIIDFSVTGNLPFSVTSWQPATAFVNQTATTQSIRVNSSDVFSVFGHTADDCVDSASVAIEVIINSDVFVPNTFTPNNDGRNDRLFVYGNTIEQVTFTVFNQWGQKIFVSTDKYNGWDGTYNGRAQPTGVYVYVLRALLANGAEVMKKGSVNLIR